MAKKIALPKFPHVKEIFESSKLYPFDLNLLVCKSCLAFVDDLYQFDIISKDQNLDAKALLIKIMQKANVQLPTLKKQKNGKATNTRKNKPSGTTKTKPATKSSTNTKSKTKSNRKSK